MAYPDILPVRYYIQHNYDVRSIQVFLFFFEEIQSQAPVELQQQCKYQLSLTYLVDWVLHYVLFVYHTESNISHHRLSNDYEHIPWHMDI